MTETLKKLLVNLLVWCAFATVLLGLNNLAADTQAGELNAVSALKRLIEPKLVILQVLAVLLLLGIFAILTQMLSSRALGRRLTGLLRLSTDEAGSILTNFASLLVIASFVTGELLVSLGIGVCIYAVAYVLLFRPTGLPLIKHQWMATYPRISEVKEEVTLEYSGTRVMGTIKPVEGPDVGRVYALEGSTRDRMLVGHFEAMHDGSQDKGAFVLSLDVAGREYRGRIVYTHDSGKLVNEEWVVRR